MGSHSEHHDHSNEKKPVSFIVPLIFGLVVTLGILLLVSLGDPKHGCCDDGGHGKEGKECKKEDAHHGEAHGESHAEGHEATEGGHH